MDHRLVIARQELLDAEEIAKLTLEELKDQREKLNNANIRLKEANAEIKKSNILLDKMLKWFRRI